MKTGLVLEGGAMRGMFTCGVTDLMMEEGFTFDGIIGVSAGAAFGSNIKSGQAGRAIRYNTRFSRDPRYCGFRSLIKTGDFYGVDFCYREIPEKYDPFDNEAFCASPTEFYVVATDIETGEAVYHRCDTGVGEDLAWIRASASMPLASRIVEAGGRKLLDGGVTDSVPLEYFNSIGYEKNVVVLTRPRGYQKKPGKTAALMKAVYRKYPKLIEAYKRRHEVYNRTLEKIFESEKRGDTFVICPREPLLIDRVERDPDVLMRVYSNGKDTCRELLPKLREFMESPAE